MLFGTDYPTRDGTCLRDYVHVSDLADAHVRAVEALLAGGPGGAYNLGTGEGRSNREVLEAVGAVVGRPVPYREGPRREGDPAELVADSARFRRDFAWGPLRSDLDTILRTAWAWLQEWKGGTELGLPPPGQQVGSSTPSPQSSAPERPRRFIIFWSDWRGMPSRSAAWLLLPVSRAPRGSCGA